MKQLGFSLMAWAIENVLTTLEIVQQFLKKLNLHLTYSPAVPLRVLSKKNKNIFAQKELFAQMATEILFIIARNWKQPKCLTMGELTSKFGYIYKMEYDSALKNNYILHTKWINFENMLNKRSQSHKSTYYLISFI